MPTFDATLTLDALARALGQRRVGRGVAQRLAASWLLASGALLSGTARVAACRANGRSCRTARPEQCCGGRCAGRGDTGTCRALRAARGCTRRDDACRRAAADTLPCPKRPAGICLLVDDLPACGQGLECFDCRRDRDCRPLAGPGVPVRCITQCAACDHTNNRACVALF